MKAVAILLTAAALCACELPVNGTGPDIEIPPPPNPKTAADTTPIEVVDAATPRTDAGFPEAPVCHATAPGYYKDYPVDWCSVAPPNLAELASSGVTVVIGRDPDNKCVPLMLPATSCDACDYTCDCVLKLLCSGKDCTCQQSTPGGIILFGPIPIQP